MHSLESQTLHGDIATNLMSCLAELAAFIRTISLMCQLDVFMSKYTMLQAVHDISSTKLQLKFSHPVQIDTEVVTLWVNNDSGYLAKRIFLAYHLSSCYLLLLAHKSSLVHISKCCFEEQIKIHQKLCRSLIASLECIQIKICLPW